MLVDPDFEHAIFDRRREEGLHVAQPCDLTVTGIIRLVLVAVADEYDRFGRAACHFLPAPPRQITKACKNIALASITDGGHVLDAGKCLGMLTNVHK
jgi:hypothetical protein